MRGATSDVDREREGEAGFTLLELLIAMTLLGLVMALLFGGLRFGARAWERSDAHATGMDDVRIAQALLRRAIEDAYPSLILSDPVHPHMDFDGESDRLIFLAPAPASLAPAGRAYMTLGVASGGGNIALMLSLRPELAWPDDRAATKTEVLLDHIRAVRFAYFGGGGPGAPGAWQDRWSDRLRLPDLVRLSVEFEPGDARQWPDLVVAPRIAVDVGCVYDPLTKYCRGR